MVIQNPRRGEAAASAAATIVVEIPTHLKHLVAPIENLVDSVGKRADQLSRDGRSVDYAAIERGYAELSAAVETAAHQCTLAAAAASEPQRDEVRGETYSRVGEGIGTYKTMTGPVPVHRSIYRRLGERNGKTVDLFSLRTGAIGNGWLPQTARAMAHHLQSGTSREAEQSVKQTCRLPYSRASFERVPHLVGELWLEHHADIEDELIKAFEIPAEAASVSLHPDEPCQDWCAVIRVLYGTPTPIVGVIGPLKGNCETPKLELDADGKVSVFRSFRRLVGELGSWPWRMSGGSYGE